MKRFYFQKIRLAKRIAENNCERYRILADQALDADNMAKYHDYMCSYYRKRGNIATSSFLPNQGWRFYLHMANYHFNCAMAERISEIKKILPIATNCVSANTPTAKPSKKKTST